MTGTKISDLPSASTLTGAELVPVVQSDVTKKTTVSDILTSAGAGTVTSVNVSGGTTGLTTSGGPITTSGTITLAGTLDVDNGGTGATTAANARTNLDVPSRSGSGATGTWSIDVTGNAGTVTNGVYTTGSYSNPAWITALAGSKITGDISGNAGNVTGTVAVLNGGTGATTAANARINLLPSYTGNANKVLALNSGGTDVQWIAASGSGTVTSVDASGGSTGLTFSGGPITGSGTLTMAGTLGLGYGGTGATTAPNARINLLPSYTGNAGKVLALNVGGTDVEWISAGGTGTVTSVAGTGTVNGITLTGTVTSSGSLTLGGALLGVDLTSQITGILPVANGGTNNSVVPPAGSVAYGNGTQLAYTATGSAGQYLQSAGSGTPVWSSISSGVGSTAYSGAFQDTTTQSIASVTTAYPITLNTDDYVNGVTRGTPTSRIVFANAGLYNIQWSGQFQNTSVSLQDVRVWIRLNGTDVAGTTGYLSVPNSHGGTDGHMIAAWNYVLNLAAGDYIEFYWSSTSTAVTLQPYAAGTSPVSPTAASVIVTANQLTQIGIGYYGLSSSSSVLIGTGSKTFTTNLNATNTAFTVGSRVRVAYTTTPTNFMEGTITAFSGTSMTVDVDVVGGSGTYAAWSFTSVGSAGVTSISGGTTGLTPSTATTGAVTLAGTLAVANGGTGATTQQSALNALAGATTSAYYLRGNGTNVSMSALAAADLTGTVAVAAGGTGLTSTPTNGQIDIGNGSGFTRTTLTAGSNISITNGAGSITIASTSSGISTGKSIAMAMIFGF